MAILSGGVLVEKSDTMVEIMNHQCRVCPGTAVVFLHGSYDQYKTLLQNATEWCCIHSVSADKRVPLQLGERSIYEQL
ncbi:hypothetical protein AV530_012353 [Patagioenas fasciata monilis]|uniref:Uncharacterized protein n=1 Tax=Patagioenas fasciata monilis TaxID=372326 RepID=A0A1V4JAP7_PATFA|nr:hypothetical protein AV530_012353 [Patagioenas fasciata monilis]